MEAPPTLSPGILAALPPAVVALIAWQAEQIRVLTARVAELEAALGKNPQNSSKPPSSTHPHAKPTPRPPSRSRRARGGQPGHAKHQRALLPTEQCQAVIPCVPAACRRCGQALTGADPAPLRHQVWEIPDIRPIVRNISNIASSAPVAVPPVARCRTGCPRGKRGRGWSPSPVCS